MTGAGGFLQTVWAGYGGVRFEGLGVLWLRNPSPLPKSTGLKLRGIHLLGAKVDVFAAAQAWSVALSPQSPPTAPALCVVGNNGTASALLPGRTVWMQAGEDARVKACNKCAATVGRIV